MEECNDNRSMVNTVCKTTPSPKLKPKKRSLVERELETSLTSRITSPISNSETINTSRYGRARRLKNDLLISTDRKKDSPSPINNTEKSPNEELCTYKMYASTSPAKTQSTKNGLDNQIENIYNQNLSLSRFNSDGKTEKNLKSKIYMRQDLIQTRDKEETIILIKNMFSPNQNVPQEEFTSSSEKSSKNYKRQLSSVVKTLDFDGKKKREGQEKKMTQSDLFELEAQCEYQVGDLAWARMGTYPFWPSIVTREPNSNLFIKKKLFGKLEKDIIHVTFLGDNGRRGWILLSMLRKYLGPLEFEKARDNFSSDAKRKDYRLYAAFFVTGKRLPLWHLSVEEAEVLFKEPKRFRIDTLNSMLNKGKECKSIPAKSKKVKSTDSDISLSESLYDSLFSEDDYKVSDTESGRCKTGKKPFDVSEVVTACLDNMAAKTGITKIQKQSHMDIWLQKAKSKTPEKCQLKQLKPEKKVITKYNESHGSMEYKQNHEKEHDYFTKSANTNGYFNDEIVDSPTNSTSVFLNNETDGANEECTNIIDKDILGISPEIMEENFTEIEVITNENMILDACDIKDLVFELDQNNHNEEHENNENLLEFNTKPNLEIANEESKFILFDKESNNEDYVTEKCGKECNADIQRVRGNCKNICIDNNLPETDNIIKKNIVTNVECYSNNFDDINVLTSGDFNQKEIQTPILSAKTETIISENVLDTNLSEDYTELITKNIKSDLTELENDSVVNDNVCTDGKAELNVLVNGQEVTTSITEIFQNKEQCLNESVEGPVIQEKQAQGNFTTYENNNVNMHRSKGVNYILTGDNFIDGSKQSAKSKFYCKDSSSSDDITDTEEITDIKHGRSMAGNVYLSHSGQIVHENSHIKNVAMHSKDIGKITEDIILSHKENENMSSHHNHQRDISLQDEATSDFKLTYDLDNEYYCDTSSETIEKNGVGHKYITIMPVELECLEMQNNVCEVDQSKLCNISKIEKSENNCKDIVDVAKSKNTKNHSSSQENGLKDAEFLKYLEQKQDIIMDENPDLTYQEVSAYLLKTWHYEQSLKSDKKVSNVYEITTTDEDNHQSLHSKTKSKTNENPNKYLQTSIGVKMLENNVKDVCIQSKPKRNAKGSDLPYKLAEVNNVKKSDNRKTSKVIASLRCSKKNIRDLLPLDKCEIGINENLEMRTVSQQICNNKNAIKNSNVPEQEAINENDTENSYFDISKSLDESIEINESVKTLSDIDISSNEKKVPKLIITHLKKITKKNMDPKNHVTNSEITILSNDTKPTLSSEEKNIDSSDKSENTENKVEFKNMTAANVNIHNSITNNDTKTISIKSDNNYIAPSEVISKEQKNEAPKHRPSLRLKRPVVTSDTNSTTAKCPTLGDMNLNEILINNEKDTKKNLEETSMTTLDNVLELTNSVEISLCKENQKARPSTSPPSDGISRKKQSKIDDFIKRTKNLNSSFNTGTDKDCKANQMTILQNSCNSNDSVNTNLVDTDQILSKQQVRKETLPTKSMDLENPEFIEYLELRQDQLIDEHPELTLEQITTYLYNTWFFEGSIKSENKKTDDFEQRSLVKGLNQSPIDAKRIRKKNYVGTEKDISSKNETPLKEKSKRRAERQFYREDFSDFEDDLDIYQMYKPTTGETKDEQGTSKNNTNTCQELLPRDLETYVADDNVVEDEIAENVDQVEEYFRLLTEPKPNLFKGLAREKVCQVCEKAGDLVKCKGCHSFFHDNCSRKGVEIKESPNPVRGRKKKRKNRGRKPKNLDDSYEGHSDKSQEHDLSFEHETESHTITNAEEFEEKLSVKLKEIIDDPNLKYDTNSSEEELDWSDVEIGACKIVEIIPKKKKQELVDFKCADCEENSVPICFVCKRTISRKKQIAHRQKCQVAHCYKYYHIECLEHWPQTQYTTAEKKGIEYVESLQCPRHVCHTCVCDDPRGCKTRFSGDKLARCLRCPATYHTFTKCLPAGTQIISGSHIICPRHYEHRPGKVPCHVNTGWCFICALGGTLICCEYCPTSFHAECLNIEPPEGGYMCEDCETGCLPLYGEMVWVKLGHYRWWPGLILHPSEIPENILAVKHAQGEFVVRFFGQYDHYWVNRGRVFPFQEGDTGRVSSRNSKIDAAFAMAVEHAHRAYDILKNKSSSNEGDEDIALSLLPPHFVKLKVNKPCGSLINKKIDIEESSLTQCECNPNVEDPCGLYSHCLNRMLLTECGPICKAGERCCNRAFEKRQYPRMEPYRTPARGWGLHTLDDIRAGQFVIEYVGELIDEVEFQRRMKWKHQVRDENYYFLTLDKERMIDAGPKGNLARFMNHSCDPNCETQKWTVLGDVRVGLFALYDIPAKSELTFNYNLECAGIEKKRCMCGTARCSGFMGAKPKQEEPKKNKVKRTYKKRKRIELSPTNEQPKPKRRQPKNRELTEIEKDLLIIKNATNGISSDSESSRRNSTDSVKRKNNSPSTKKVKIDKKKIDQPECDRTVVNHKTYDVD